MKLSTKTFANQNYHTEEYKVLGKNSKEIFFFFLIDTFFYEKTPMDLGINRLDRSDLFNHF